MTLAFSTAGSLHIEDGWHAPRYGVKHAAPVVVSTTRASSTVLVTSIDPRDAACRSTPHDVRLVAAGNGRDALTRIDVHGTGPSGTDVDTLIWASVGHQFTLGGFAGVARSAWARMDAAGRVVAFTAADVREGTWSGPGRARALGDGVPGLWILMG